MRTRVDELRTKLVTRFVIRIRDAAERARCKIRWGIKLRQFVEKAQHLFDRIQTLLKLFTGRHSKYLVQLT